MNDNRDEIKKGKKGLLAIILIAIIIIGVVVYLKLQSKPDLIFSKNINSVVDELCQQEKHDTVHSTISISASVESGNETIKQMGKYLEGSKIILNAQTDYKSKAQYMNIDIDNQNEDLISMQALVNANDSNVYIHIDDLYDKYFKVSMNEIDKDAELQSMLKEAFEQSNNKKANKKVASIIKKEINKTLSKDYFSEENVTISMDGKDEKVKRSTLTLKYSELLKIITQISNELQNNEEFLKCYENSEDIKNTLTELNTMLSKNEIEEDVTMKFSIYTKGLLGTFIKMDIVIEEDTENRVTIDLRKVNDTTYIIGIDIQNQGKINLSIETSEEYNKEITKVDTENSVELDKLSQEEMTKIYTNLQSMKIYNLIYGAIASGVNY